MTSGVGYPSKIIPSLLRQDQVKTCSMYLIYWWERQRGVGLCSLYRSGGQKLLRFTTTLPRTEHSKPFNCSKKKKLQYPIKKEKKKLHC